MQLKKIKVLMAIIAVLAFFDTFTTHLIFNVYCKDCLELNPIIRMLIAINPLLVWLWYPTIMLSWYTLINILLYYEMKTELRTIMIIYIIGLIMALIANGAIISG